MSTLRLLLDGIGWLTLAYFAALNVVYLGFAALAAFCLTRYGHRRSYAATDELFASPLTPPVSVLLPAFDEEAGIVASVTSLLALPTRRRRSSSSTTAPPTAPSPGSRRPSTSCRCGRRSEGRSRAGRSAAPTRPAGIRTSG
jgi:hypothetical protein